MTTTYTKTHLTQLKGDFPFNLKQDSRRKWAIHIEVWDGDMIDDEDFWFFDTEQERDEVYSEMVGEEE